MKIAIFRALKLGDMLCSMPAIHLLKRSFPEASIYVIGLPAMKGLCSRYPYIDHYVSFPGHPAFPEQETTSHDMANFINEMRSLKFDLLIQMHGNGTIINDILKQFGAKRLIGYCWNPMFEGPDWLLYPNGIHEVEKHLKLLGKLGSAYTPVDYQIDYPLFDNDRIAFDCWKMKYSIKKYAIIHVGSSVPERQWPLDNFLFLAEHLKTQGLQIVLTGVESEEMLVDQFVYLLDETNINMAGKTDLGLLGCLVQNASIVVSNCTGISHIAAALETKSIVISLDGEPERWGPLDSRIHLTYDATQHIDLKKISENMLALLDGGSIGKCN